MILEQLAEQAREEPVYPDRRFPPSLYYRFLKLLTAYIKPSLSVELGVCGGGGSLHMAQGWKLGRVIGVDHQDDHMENIGHILDNCYNFNFIVDDSIGVAEEIYHLYGKIDILFIDTDHTYERTLAEFNAWKPYLSYCAIVIFDDLFRHQTGAKYNMMDAWNQIPGEKIRLDFLHDGTYPHGGGFGCTIIS